LKHYQLTFNKDTVFGYVLEELYGREKCPQSEMDAILEYIYEELCENFACRYAIINLERASRPHVTAYVQLEYEPRTMKAWQKMFVERPHIIKCRGDSISNIDYLYKRGSEENLKKHDTLRWGPFEMGDAVYIPAKIDANATAKKIQNGMAYYDMAMENPEFLLSNPYGVAAAIRSRDESRSSLSPRNKFRLDIN